MCSLPPWSFAQAPPLFYFPLFTALTALFFLMFPLAQAHGSEMRGPRSNGSLCDWELCSVSVFRFGLIWCGSGRGSWSVFAHVMFHDAWWSSVACSCAREGRSWGRWFNFDHCRSVHAWTHDHVACYLTLPFSLPCLPCFVCSIHQLRHGAQSCGNSDRTWVCVTKSSILFQSSDSVWSGRAIAEGSWFEGSWGSWCVGSLEVFAREEWSGRPWC